MAARGAKSVHDDEIVGKIFDTKLYRGFFPFARPYLGWFALSVGLLLLLAVATMVTPIIVKTVIDDRVLADGEAADRIGDLGQWAGLLVGIGLLTFGLRYAQLWVANRTGQHIIYDLRNHVFRHLQRRNLRFFDKNPVGKLVTRVTSDIEALAELFSAGIDVLFYDVVMLGLTLGVLFWIDTKLALCSLALMPLIGVWSFWFKREAQELFRRVRASVTRLNSYVNECITGIRVIQIFRTEARTNERFREWDAELREAHIRTVRNFSLFFPGVEIFSSAGAAVILIVGHAQVTGGALTPGAMIAFWFLLHKFFEPLRQISEKYNVLQSAMASGERIMRILEDDSSVTNPAHPVSLAAAPTTGAIRFDRVGMSYDGVTPVLKGVDFEVAPGEKIAIVGATGAGKTSIISVLGRFYDIQEGAVLVDGLDVREVDKHELRRRIGIVLQEVFLFADTIRENLRLGDESIDDERIMEACRTVFADRFIGRLEGGLDHPVEERGATFSVGEKQLLAFARTLVHDPPILVLDEATSNIDTETELLIQRALERLMEHRTVLVIAHRLSTIKSADRIIVMHRGEVREMGTHAELLKLDGIYRRLYELQYRNQESGRAEAKGA